MSESIKQVSKSIKQVIVIRKDLKMRRGKEIAQGAHASCAFLTKRIQNNLPFSAVQRKWIEGSFRKITLQVDSEFELLDLYKKAKELGLESHLIQDSGLTEFHGVLTFTCLALGPDFDTNIDVLTANLKLY